MEIIQTIIMLIAGYVTITCLLILPVVVILRYIMTDGQIEEDDDSDDDWFEDQAL